MDSPLTSSVAYLFCHHGNDKYAEEAEELSTSLFGNMDPDALIDEDGGLKNT